MPRVRPGVARPDGEVDGSQWGLGGDTLTDSSRWGKRRKNAAFLEEPQEPDTAVGFRRRNRQSFPRVMAHRPDSPDVGGGSDEPGRIIGRSDLAWSTLQLCTNPRRLHPRTPPCAAAGVCTLDGRHGAGGGQGPYAGLPCETITKHDAGKMGRVKGLLAVRTSRFPMGTKRFFRREGHGWAVYGVTRSGTGVAAGCTIAEWFPWGGRFKTKRMINARVHISKALCGGEICNSRCEDF